LSVAAAEARAADIDSATATTRAAIIVAPSRRSRNWPWRRHRGHGFAGFLYEQGQGTVQDTTRPCAGSRTAADLGNAQAEFWVGDMYAKGYGVAKDRIEAVAGIACRLSMAKPSPSMP
jgi:TPR repeat protein